MPSMQQSLNKVNHDPIREEQETARQAVREGLAARRSSVICVVQARIQHRQLARAMNSLTIGQVLDLLAPGWGERAGGLFLYLWPILVSHSLHGVIPSILTGCGSSLASVSSLRHQ